jgi:hypothetical protein
MQTVQELQKLLSKYEENGAAKLYYALNRKMWEMAETLNNTDLKTISLDDPKDKTFDRLKTIWKDAADLSLALKSLGDIAGITGDEQKDTKRKIPISPQSIAKIV